jgi:hypothetical protein
MELDQSGWQNKEGVPMAFLPDETGPVGLALSKTKSVFQWAS